jgi:hypothetical protein
MFDVLKKITGKSHVRRRYQVPEGLAERICELKDEASKGSWVPHRALWRLVEDRCPEVKRGGWRITRNGSLLFLEEVPA